MTGIGLTVLQNTERTDGKVSGEKPAFTLLYAEINPIQIMCRERKYMLCLWKLTMSQHSDAESVFLVTQAFFSLVYLISNLYMLFFSDKRYLFLASHCQICEHRGQEEGTESFFLIFIRVWILPLFWHASDQELCILIDNLVGPMV